MSGTASVPNSFANAVTATGAQLDANFGTQVAYINDPTNRNNFAADGSATNTVILTFSPPVVGGYTTGLELTWKWGATNTGAVVLNANGLGNVSVVNPDGSPLAAAQGQIGSVGKAVYDGTRFVYLTSFGTPASKAVMQTASSAVSFVSPAQQSNHPAHPKAVAVWSGTATGTVLALYGYGVTNIVRNGAGTYIVNLSSPMTATVYPAFATCTTAGQRGAMIRSQNASQCVVITDVPSTGVPTDSDVFVQFTAYGQAA